MIQTNTPEVKYITGKAATRKCLTTNDSKPFQVAGDKMLLRIPKVTRFLIRDGCEIIIEKAKEADDDDVRLFLLGERNGGGSTLSGSNPASWQRFFS